MAGWMALGRCWNYLRQRLHPAPLSPAGRTAFRACARSLTPTGRPPSLSGAFMEVFAPDAFGVTPLVAHACGSSPCMRSGPRVRRAVHCTSALGWPVYHHAYTTPRRDGKLDTQSHTTRKRSSHMSKRNPYILSNYPTGTFFPIATELCLLPRPLCVEWNTRVLDRAAFHPWKLL